MFLWTLQWYIPCSSRSSANCQDIRGGCTVRLSTVFDYKATQLNNWLSMTNTYIVLWWKYPLKTRKEAQLTTWVDLSSWRNTTTHWFLQATTFRRNLQSNVFSNVTPKSLHTTRNCEVMSTLSSYLSQYVSEEISRNGISLFDSNCDNSLSVKNSYMGLRPPSYVSSSQLSLTMKHTENSVIRVYSKCDMSRQPTRETPWHIFTRPSWSDKHESIFTRQSWSDKHGPSQKAYWRS
jgi:hypothetical protein